MANNSMDATEKTAGVAIDSWKLLIFKRHLDAASFEYTEHPGVTADTLILKVKYGSLDILESVITKAQMECKRNAR